MPRQRIYHGHRLRVGRYSEPGRVYLVTTVTANRSPVFSNWRTARECARTIHQFAGDAAIKTHCWVIMPDHVHWLVTLQEGTLGGIMRRFKAVTARRINRVVGTQGTVWQRGYHDHAVRHDEDLRSLARYVVGNPVRAGLCERVLDYPFWDAIWLNGAADTAGPEDAVW